MAKKSFYIFLTSLLGILLFLILHRIVVFIYLYLVATDVLYTGNTYYEFLAWDYFSLVITLMLGAWYGIWLGLYWFKRVYEDNNHGGLVAHLSSRIFAPNPTNLSGRMEAVKERLEKDLWQLEDITNTAEIEVPAVVPVKRKIVRKRAPKKIVSK